MNFANLTPEEYAAAVHEQDLIDQPQIDRYETDLDDLKPFLHEFQLDHGYARFWLESWSAWDDSFGRAERDYVRGLVRPLDLIRHQFICEINSLARCALGE